MFSLIDAWQRLTLRCLLWIRLDAGSRHGEGASVCDGAAPGQVGAIGPPLPLPIHLHFCHIWHTLSQQPTNLGHDSASKSLPLLELKHASKTVITSAFETHPRLL